MSFESKVRFLESPFVEKIWSIQDEPAGVFTSTAEAQGEIVITKFEGKTHLTIRGPETSASIAEMPADADFFGIVLKLGTYMPHLPNRTLRDRQDVTLPDACSNAFWLQGAAWEYPTFDNADVFVERLVREGYLVSDDVVQSVLRGNAVDISKRSIQRHFVTATGLTQKTIEQIHRAHEATALLEQGVSILDTALELGYYDQSHLTNALTRFIGHTPAQVIQQMTDG